MPAVNAATVPANCKRERERERERKNYHSDSRAD